MTINDILPQMPRPAARHAHAEAPKSKSALSSADEKTADVKMAANFEALVKEFTGKAEKRSSRTSDADEAETGQEKEDTTPSTREPGSASAIATQAMLAFDPFHVKRMEAAVASGDTAQAQAGNVGETGRRNLQRPDAAKEIQLDESVDVQPQSVKPGGKTAKSAEKTGHPVELGQKPDRAVLNGQSVPDNGGTAPVTKDGEPTQVPPAGNEGGSREATERDAKPAVQPDAGSATGKGRGSEVSHNGPLQPAPQGRTGSVSNPPSLANAAAAPARPAIHIADVEIISERSYGATKTLNIRLQPVDLGTVTARLRLVPEGMQVDLVADKRETAQRLAADRDLLGKALQTAGLDDKAFLAITVTERGQSSTANMSGNQAGQQSFAPQDQSAGRQGAHPQTNMQGEGNGNRDQRGGWGADEQAGSAPLAPTDAPGGRPLSRGLVV